MYSSILTSINKIFKNISADLIYPDKPFGMPLIRAQIAKLCAVHRLDDVIVGIGHRNKSLTELLYRLMMKAVGSYALRACKSGKRRSLDYAYRVRKAVLGLGLRVCDSAPTVKNTPSQ